MNFQSSLGADQMCGDIIMTAPYVGVEMYSRRHWTITKNAIHR